MGQERRKPNLTCDLVNRGRLDGSDLVLAKGFAHDIEATGERGIAEGSITFPREWRADGGDQGFLRVGQLGLRFDQRSSDGADRFTGAVHWRPPPGQN